jgi:hypothetical protein
MRRQFEGGDNKAQVREACGDYSSAASIRGRRLIEEIRYAFVGGVWGYDPGL